MFRRSIALMSVVVAVAACAGSDDDAADTTTVGSAAPSSTSRDTVPATTDVAETTSPPETTVAPTTAPPSTTPATTAPPTAPPTTAPAEFAPVAAGPYEVGVQTITLDDPERPLTVEVWFPLAADTDPASLAPMQYTLLPGVYYESPDAFAATPDLVSGDGPFPLVVYSHGSGGLRYIHSAYTEALASHGYIVAAPDHTGNTAIERIAGAGDDPAVISLNRPNDVDRVIDALTDPTDAAAGPAAAHVDAEQVVVTGHSFGGFTTIAMVTGYSNGLGEFAPDDRVDAIVPIAPAVGDAAFSDEALATIEVPMMVVVGTDDVTTPVDPNVTRLWANATSSSPAYRIELVAAEHQSFTDICDYQDAVPSLPDVPAVVVETIDAYAVEGCSEGDMARERVAELLDTYVIAFLDEALDDGPPVLEVTGTPPEDVIVDAR